jgi:hypothetical protein
MEFWSSTTLQDADRQEFPNRAWEREKKPSFFKKLGLSAFIAFFVLVKYKKGQTLMFAPTSNVFYAKEKCYISLNLYSSLISALWFPPVYSMPLS